MGEFIGMFLMLLLGLGSGIYLKKPSPYVVGGCWGGAVTLGNLAGSLFGSTSMNPIFSLSAWGMGQISYQVFLKQVIGQLLGAGSATLLLLVVCASRELSLMNFAALAKGSSSNYNFLLEVLGTLTLLVGSHILALIFPVTILKTLAMGVLISLLIIVLGPITGASFNPIRDFIPRTVFSLMQGNLKSGNYPTKSIITSNVAPLVAAVVFIGIWQVCNN